MHTDNYQQIKFDFFFNFEIYNFISIIYTRIKPDNYTGFLNIYFVKAQIQLNLPEFNIEF